MLTEPKTDSFLPTRQSLLSRLRDWQDHNGWREFFDTYWRLIYRVARQAEARSSRAPMAPIIIRARGQAAPGVGTDVAIGEISIGGRVERAQIFAGYDVSLVPKNATRRSAAWPSARIGSRAASSPAR